MTTFDLIEEYFKSVLGYHNYLNLRLKEYSLNGSIIKLIYNYDFDEVDTCYGNVLEVELLDYITFVYSRV